MTTPTPTGAAELPKCIAADGSTEVIHVPGYPLMVRAVDFNRLRAKVEELSAAQAELAAMRAGGEPVAEMVPYHTPSGKRVAVISRFQHLPIGTKLYTHPQPAAPAQSGVRQFTDDERQFTKKPVTIQAIQWTGRNLREVIAFTDGPPDTRSAHAGMAWDAYVDLVARDGLKIYTLEGKMSAAVGDWIIKGVQGEHYPCKDEIFEATYSRASRGQAPAVAADRIVAGAIFDFVGYLTTRDERITMSSTSEASPAVEAIKTWAARRGLSLDEADVSGWRDQIAPQQDAGVLEDAARYRWIRGPVEESTRYSRWRIEYWDGPNGWQPMQRERMDSAIDAARKQGGA